MGKVAKNSKKLNVKREGVTATKGTKPKKIHKPLKKVKGKEKLTSKPQKALGKNIKKEKGATTKSPKKKSPKSNKKVSRMPERGVVYFSHLPHGFYEKQLTDYCSQFGSVTGVYLPKSRNDNYRGYGFVEFKHAEVAKVVAETMNNYLMFTRLIKAVYIPPEQQKPFVFKTVKKHRKQVKIDRKMGFIKRTRNIDEDKIEKFKTRMQTKVEKIHKKLQSSGLDYDIILGPA